MNDDYLQLTDTKKKLLELMIQKRKQNEEKKTQEEIVGNVEITPSQAEELCIYNPDRHIFNISILLEVKVKIERQVLEKLLVAIINHHDALRLCTIKEKEGWKQSIAAPIKEAPLSYFDFSQEAAYDHKGLIEVQTALLQKSFDLSKGPLLKGAYFNLGEGTADRLMFILHHFGCDHYSIIILLEDASAVLNQLMAGKPVRLPAKTTSLQTWAAQLKAYSLTEDIIRELPYWLKKERKMVLALPKDYEDGINVGKDMVEHSQVLNREKGSFPSASYLLKKNLRIQDIIIASGAMALMMWTGGNKAHIALCHYGRNHIFPDIDITRTVGFFSYQFPLFLDLEGCNTPNEILWTVKKQIDNIPYEGLNYGILKHLSKPSIRDKFNDFPTPELYLNIRTVSSSLKLAGFELAEEKMGSAHSQTIIRPHYIYLNVDINIDTIVFYCQYNKNIHKDESICHFIDDYINNVIILGGNV